MLAESGAKSSLLQCGMADLEDLEDDQQIQQILAEVLFSLLNSTDFESEIDQ